MTFRFEPFMGLVLLIPMVASIPLIASFYYRLHKSGLILCVREGISVMCVIDRARMLEANRLYRRFSDLREERLKIIGATM